MPSDMVTVHLHKRVHVRILSDFTLTSTNDIDSTQKKHEM